MRYESLSEKLDTILSCINLRESEKLLMQLVYLYPGIKAKKLKSSFHNAEKWSKSLLEQGLFISYEKDGEDRIYPIPLALLIERYSHRKLRVGKTQQELLQLVCTIEQWIKYPILRSDKNKLCCAKNRDDVLTFFFDLHKASWEWVYCFGDYESFIDSVGADIEREWIRERIKKSRKASVIATKDGHWAQYIHRQDKYELRNCMIQPKDFSGTFIMSFPEICTTLVGGADSDMTFIHSSEISWRYADLVTSSMELV